MLEGCDINCIRLLSNSVFRGEPLSDSEKVDFAYALHQLLETVDKEKITSTLSTLSVFSNTVGGLGRLCKVEKRHPGYEDKYDPKTINEKERIRRVAIAYAQRNDVEPDGKWKTLIDKLKEVKNNYQP
jgi:hypothetical protein